MARTKEQGEKWKRKLKGVIEVQKRRGREMERKETRDRRERDANQKVGNERWERDRRKGKGL